MPRTRSRARRWPRAARRTATRSTSTSSASSAAQGDRVGLGIDLTHEAMSGATPWYVTPDENGDPVQVMTGATIDERRTDALSRATTTSTAARRRWAAASRPRTTTSPSTRTSAASATSTRRTPRSRAEWAVVGHDHAERHRAQFPNRVDEENKQAYNGYLALGHVLGRATIVQTSVKYQFNTRLPVRSLQALARGGHPGDRRAPRPAPPDLVAHALPPPLQADRGDAAPRLHALRRRLEHELAHDRARLVPDAVRPAAHRPVGALLLAGPGRLLRAVLHQLAQRRPPLERLSPVAVRRLLLPRRGRGPVRHLGLQVGASTRPSSAT